MKVEIITIGDELLIGQVVDTNSAWMAEKLNAIGLSVHQITSIHDDAEHIKTALQEALTRVEVVLLTGGLGPTKDDITKTTLCDFFHTHLVESERVKAHVMDLYKYRPNVLNSLTATQWLVPEKCQVIDNEVGSAPVMWFEAGTKEHRQVVVSMPGVPHEMENAMTRHILPMLDEMSGKSYIVHHTLLLSGIPESVLALQIEAWETALPPYMHLAYLPKDGMIRLRLSALRGTNEIASKAVLEAEVAQQIEALLPLVQGYVLAVEEKPLEVLVGQLLLQKGYTIGSAESCTGGKIAVLLNKQPGSSAFYKGSVVAYSNEVKHAVLGVSEQALKQYGAVSETVVEQMAVGVRNLLHTDFALATSGIAGPTGGTAQKPVGTVWLALATPFGVKTQLLRAGRLREQITTRAANAALIMALKALQNSK